eukprot:CAMPEP_0197608150 /NCGR_PEP_ID=MMETSP1326-20131121/48481_1 /TAXON_ID=1155430 /ORGANISM="Genus nov. species nov., Strain RCC2288" /LENGTH=73 /DNA_ID=CAMNT_0043176313 /DNA_START=23 /DNA_END=241 /DNA_ORIENTATION=+
MPRNPSPDHRGSAGNSSCVGGVATTTLKSSPTSSRVTLARSRSRFSSPTADSKPAAGKSASSTGDELSSPPPP